MNIRQEQFCRLIQKASFLKHVHLFRHFSSASLAGIARITQNVEILENHILFEKGDFADDMYIVREGQISIEIDKSQMTVLGRFECMGELAVLGESLRTATAVAKTDTVLLRIFSEDFKNLLTLYPGVSIELMRILTDRLKQRENIQLGS